LPSLISVRRNRDGTLDTGLRPVGIAYEDDALVLGGVCAPSPECQASMARCLWQQVMAQPETAAK